ncbi:MAG: PAS domain-containing methyl-accepting chemotaxis protein [Methanomicrobiaceae archaeon]|nr:PAS domain-containing methyl-accepting chemotaxis protein [Methanomicrobiaceae archaeon]
MAAAKKKSTVTGTQMGMPAPESQQNMDYEFIESFTSAIEAVKAGVSDVQIDPATLAKPLRPLAKAMNEVFKKIAADAEIQRQNGTLFRENPLPMVLLNSSFELVDLNESYENLMEQPRDKLLSMETTDYKIKLLTGDRTDKTFKGVHTKCELQFTFKDGRTKIIEQFGIPVNDETGSTASAYFVYNDITTERKEAEEIEKQMKKNAALQRRAETIVQENPMPILLLTKAFKIVVTNDAFVQMSGYTREDVLAMNARDFTILDQKGEGLGKVIKETKRSFGEVTVELPSGTHILEQHGIPILNGDGEITNILIVYNDVTVERREMAEVNTLKKRAEAFIKENPQAITILANDKHRLDLNKEYERVWRGSYDALMAKKLYDFDITITGGDDFYASYETKKKAVTSMEVAWPNGEKSYLILYQVPILDEKGEIDVNYYIYQDVTEDNRKEKEVQNLMETAQTEAARLNTSAGTLADAMTKMANGDLTAFVTLEDNDPLETLKQDYNKSITAMKELIEQVGQEALQVEGTSQEVTKSSDEIGRATEQVAVATQESSEFTRNLLAQIEDINREISDLSASIEEIASTTQEVMSRSQKAAAEGSKTAEIGRDAHTKMQLVGAISEEAVTEITQLNDEMREISNIVKLIGGIAAQTNLLALNAAIEAARAGEHGRGFAVVAGEIRNLAGESKDASQHIEDLIMSIQTKSAKTAASMKTSHTEIQQGIASVNSTIEGLNRIVTDVETAAHGITEITKAAEDQAHATNRVMQSMEDSTSLTKENMERIEDMAALAEEVSASVEEVGSASHEMTDMAGRLMTMMKKFKLN